MDTVLRLDSPGSLNSSVLNSKGVKRKWSLRDGSVDPEGGLPLSLWVGHSSSSSDSKESSATGCTTMSSYKETDCEESTMDLDLEFSLHLGSDKAPLKKKTSGIHKLSLHIEDQDGLELSLSSTPAESDISNVQPNYVFEDMNKGSVSSSVVTIPTSSVTCFSGVVRQHNRNSSTKICQFDGCEKGARGASGRCISHGGGRRCQKLECHKGAEGRTAFCKAHGGGRRCEFLGCTKSAEGHTDYCIAHGGGRRCSHEACTRAARGKSGLCIRHGGGKRCQMVNCTKSAEGLSGLCISHGGGRRCQFPACTKGAQGSTMYCKAHGGGKRCTFEGCNKGAEGSTPYCKGHGGGKRCAFEGDEACSKSVHGGTLYCVAHGGGKRCVVPECTRSARGRTDCCVRHGGGKRCKSEGCGKSAQGSTDFCKAHGGGKRCSWGQPGSEYGRSDEMCNLFARGKNGLCTSHGALVQDNRVHGGATLRTLVRDTTEDMNIDTNVMVSSHFSGCGWQRLGVPEGSSAGQGPPMVSEGRVHGGSLLALLARNSADTSDQAKVNMMPQKWI
uniref:uncharacterized protein LOC122610452 n=1 Tax=Erigeron canadensis TaxID=72917 RepID=UPI001CB89C5D|nr:uncharacterized protein LOC122610452 [Erigeron canadensis]